MAAPKGNEFWKLREEHGRSKILTPKELFLLAYDYKQHIDSNPIKVQDNKGTKNVNEIELKRPYTWDGFEYFVFEKTGLAKLEDYRKAEGTYEDFSDIIHIINKIFRSQKFEGAAVGIFKENIIARDLGLKEKSETELSGKDGKPLYGDYTNMSTEELQKRADAINKLSKKDNVRE